MLPYLKLSDIRYVSRVKWNNPEKGVAPSPTPRCSSYWKGSFLVNLNWRETILQLFTLYLKLSKLTHEILHYSFWSDSTICWENISIYKPKNLVGLYHYFYKSVLTVNYQLEEQYWKMTNTIRNSINYFVSFNWIISRSSFQYDHHHYHHHVVPLARISLILSRHFSLSFIASGRSSGLHPV